MTSPLGVKWRQLARISQSSGRQLIVVIGQKSNEYQDLGLIGNCADNRAWYAIHVRSKCEVVVSASLRAKGYEEFLPFYRAERCWSDRAKQLDLPLFPGYLFCRFDVADRLLPILTTPGVVSIVGVGKSPVPICNEEITGIQTILRSGLAVEPWAFVDVGTRVVLERGPLAGLEGVVTNVNKKHRLVLSVQLLQRSVAAEIDLDWARPVPKGVRPELLAQAATSDGRR
jgi:transcription antitermination factor NusG